MKSKDFTWSSNLSKTSQRFVPEILEIFLRNIEVAHSPVDSLKTVRRYFCCCCCFCPFFFLLLLISYMVKLLRSTGWSDATTELNFLNKKVLVVLKCEFICNCVV